jgi:hypothetical protein
VLEESPSWNLIPPSFPTTLNLEQIHQQFSKERWYQCNQAIAKSLVAHSVICHAAVPYPLYSSSPFTNLMILD